MKCYTGKFVKSRDQNPMEPKLVDCDKYEDMCLSLYADKTDWTKHCFKRSDLPEIRDKCIEIMVCNINEYLFCEFITMYLQFSTFQTSVKQ